MARGEAPPGSASSEDTTEGRAVALQYSSHPPSASSPPSHMRCAAGFGVDVNLEGSSPIATAAAARLTAARRLVVASRSREQRLPSCPLQCLLPLTPGEVTSTRVRRCAGESSATSMARRWASRRDLRSGVFGSPSRCIDDDADEADDEQEEEEVWRAPAPSPAPPGPEWSPDRPVACAPASVPRYLAAPPNAAGPALARSRSAGMVSAARLCTAAMKADAPLLLRGNR